MLEIIKDIVEHSRHFHTDRIDYLVALHLLAKFKEKRAFPTIIEIAGLPADCVKGILGDFISESLVSLIVSTYNGDLQAIKALIENEEAYIWCRVAALHSLLGLFVLNEISREEIIEYYRALINSDLAENCDFISTVVSDACDLYPIELYSEIIDLFDRKLVDTWLVKKSDLQKFLMLGMNDVSKRMY